MEQTVYVGNREILPELPHLRGPFWRCTWNNGLPVLIAHCSLIRLPLRSVIVPGRVCGYLCSILMGYCMCSGGSYRHPAFRYKIGVSKGRSVSVTPPRQALSHITSSAGSFASAINSPVGKSRERKRSLVGVSNPVKSGCIATLGQYNFPPGGVIGTPGRLRDA